MVTNKNGNGKKFLQVSTPDSLAVDMPLKTCKKKRIHYVADPHIEPYKKYGRTYYRYRRGIDPPVHLGTADFILNAVTICRAGERVGK
jgi:hypothetical protein